MAEGICCNTHSQDCIDENLFGTKDVRVVILELLIHFEVDPTYRFSLHRWPLRNVTIDGVSLHEHERRYMQIQKKFQTNIRPCKGQRKYKTLARLTASANECKRQRLLGEESIKEVTTKDCCVYHYC